MLSSGAILQGRYKIIEMLGQGGFGAVYQARHIQLGTMVAIKETLHNQPKLLDKFEFEAKILANLRHANLPRVTDYFNEDSSYYLVMDYIPGQDLGEYITQYPHGQLDERTALQIIAPILDALYYMHTSVNNPASGTIVPIIHRDIKLANIRVTPHGEVFLVDFGLAKFYDANDQKSTKVIACSPGYAPLEQYRGKAEIRSDLYAVGATLYTILSGQPPVDALTRSSGVDIEPLCAKNPTVSPRTEQVIVRLLAMKPEDRYQSIVELRHALALPTRMFGETAAPVAPPSAEPVHQGGSRSYRKIAMLVLLVGGLGGTGLLGLVGWNHFAGSPEDVTLAAITSDTPATDVNVAPARTLIPMPTDTAMPVATDTPTPSPTSTIASTSTSAPTRTHTPTRTPTPSDTATPRPQITVTGNISPDDVYIGDLPRTLTIRGDNLDTVERVSLEAEGRADIRLSIEDATDERLTLRLANVPENELGGEVLYTLYLDAAAQPAEIALRDYIERREVQGVRSDYAYSARIAENEAGIWYTRLRQQPDSDSAPIGMLSNDDTVDILNDSTPDWYEIRIQSSTHADVEGNIGWIERWLVDDEEVPPRPTATPTPPPATPAPVAPVEPVQPVVPVQPTNAPVPPPPPPPPPQDPPPSGPDEY